MIVADTGAMIALFDRSDRHHETVRRLYEDDPDAWLLPWAVLPEIDYLVAAHLGTRAEDLWLADLASGAFAVEWGRQEDLAAADRLCRRYKTLRLGLVDAVVITTAERLRAEAIATLDLKHFGAVPIKGKPRLLPRDA
ncbi:MAG: PIN domain-containing protein [Acidobacteria bacterium]|nr:PIN domain-containing protein [Acidobacteriota bacterium]